MTLFNRILLVINIIILFNSLIFAQEEKEFIKNDAIYKRGSNWVTISSGLGYNFKLKTQETNADVSFALQAYKKLCLQSGYHLSSDEFFLNRSLQSLKDIHLGVGMRKEDSDFNYACFIGPSYSYGSYFYGTYLMNRKLYKTFRTVGLFANAQITYKLFYDIGIGLSLYTSINKYYQIAGVQVHLYLSGAYKGKINKE